MKDPAGKLYLAILRPGGVLTTYRAGERESFGPLSRRELMALAIASMQQAIDMPDGEDGR